MKGKTFRVHREVAKAFIPNTGDKPCVNHKDGCKTNNNVSNLEWVTHSENMLHAFENGLIVNPSGLDNSRVKLNSEETSLQRGFYKPRCKIYGQRALSRLFGVNKSTIKRYLEWDMPV